MERIIVDMPPQFSIVKCKQIADDSSPTTMASKSHCLRAVRRRWPSEVVSKGSIHLTHTDFVGPIEVAINKLEAMLLCSDVIRVLLAWPSPPVVCLDTALASFEYIAATINNDDEGPLEAGRVECEARMGQVMINGLKTR